MAFRIRERSVSDMCIPRLPNPTMAVKYLITSRFAKREKNLPLRAIFQPASDSFYVDNPEKCDNRNARVWRAPFVGGNHLN